MTKQDLQRLYIEIVNVADSDRSAASVLNGVEFAKLRAFVSSPAEPSAKPTMKCDGGGTCPEPQWCTEEQACLWHRWNK